MIDDNRATRRSDKQCREIADRTKRYYGTERLRPVNILRILKSGRILTERGEKRLIYKVVDDRELGNKDGKACLANGEIEVTVRRSIDQKASWGDGRSRMTLAHELGHGVMHATEGTTSYRGAGAAGTTELSETRAPESAEHQAKVFASAFLIDDQVARTLGSAEDISTEFLVSLEAARICFERIKREIERAETAKRVERLNEEYQGRVRENAQPIHYVEDPCNHCGYATLVPIGIKFICHTCGNTCDRTSNGD
jgi:Zn-dependent peptidase ImmA (M78 family)